MWNKGLIRLWRKVRVDIDQERDDISKFHPGIKIAILISKYLAIRDVGKSTLD